MSRARRMARCATAITAAMAVSLAVSLPAQADTPPGNGHHSGRAAPGSDVKPVAPDFNNGKKQPLKHKARLRSTLQRRVVTPVGGTKTWLAEDDYKSSIYTKKYTLRGIGDHIEVWVANDRAFPGDDCRNALGLTDITDAQVDSFIHEFDGNIYPKEADSFSVAPDQDGSDAKEAALGVPDGYFDVGANRADDIVVLVDNVRDANYYAPDTPSGQTYVAGFFYSVFNNYTDRNIMTIDAYDWMHRTGANPPDDSDDPAYQKCQYASGAPRPRLYEGTFAHEYQHLLEHYADPDEVTWINEGLSDYAQSLVGYVDTSVSVTDPSADSHIGCFSGFLTDEGYGGPENSLTRWGDQGPPEILCDYGAAYSFMQYLYGHFGEKFMSALHKEPGNGLTGLNNVLDQFDSSESAMDLVHKWAAMAALDNIVDGPGYFLGGDEDAYSEDSLGMQVNFDATYDDINHDGTADDPGNEAYSTPGAPPNGSDYVRLRDKHGRNAGLKGLRALSFTADGTLEPDPVKWTVDDTPPDGTGGLACGTPSEGNGGAAFYSGCGASLDRAITRTVSVPEDATDLTFNALYSTEKGWDFGFVQVYDADKGQYVTLPCTGTTSEHAAGAIPAVQHNLPGYNGDSEGWQSETCDLSAYAGQDVEIAFRYITDTGTNLAGWWVKDVAVGGMPVGDVSLDGWRSATQAHPTPVKGFTVQLIAYTPYGLVSGIYQLPVHRGAGGDFHGRFGRHFEHQVRMDLQKRFKQSEREQGGAHAQSLGSALHRITVAAIVMQDDPTETVGKYARYTLTANGVIQPGG